MNWEAIGAIGEIIGAAAVVATLFYLARQINDGSKQIKMASLAELNTLYNDGFLPIYNSRENMEIWVRGLAAPDELVEVQREIFFLFVRRLANPFDTAVAQFLEGTLDQHHFERYRIYMKEMLDTPGGVAWLAATPQALTADAIKLLKLEDAEQDRTRRFQPPNKTMKTVVRQLIEPNAVESGDNLFRIGELGGAITRGLSPIRQAAHVTIQDLGSIGELVGAIATIATLVYLATQIRHNTKAARSDSAWSATVALAELCEEVAASPQLAELVMRAHDPDTNPEDLSDSEFAQIYFVCRSVLFKYEGQWSYWKEGILSDEMWQNRRRWAKAFVSLPVPGRVWEREMAQHQYSAGFVESIESMESPADVHIRV